MHPRLNRSVKILPLPERDDTSDPANLRFGTMQNSLNLRLGLVLNGTYYSVPICVLKLNPATLIFPDLVK